MLRTGNKNKKRAAEAARRKTHSSNAATQSVDRHRECQKGECVFTKRQKHILYICQVFDCVAKQSYHATLQNAISFERSSRTVFPSCCYMIYAFRAVSSATNEPQSTLCHPERSEGSFKRFFVAALLRMTDYERKILSFTNYALSRIAGAHLTFVKKEFVASYDFVPITKPNQRNTSYTVTLMNGESFSCVGNPDYPF